MSIYYIIISMIDGFEAFINLAVMVLTIIASMQRQESPAGRLLYRFTAHTSDLRLQGKRSCSGDILWLLSEL